jgi:hypothetical protein
MTAARNLLLTVAALIALVAFADAQVPADLRTAMEGRDRAFYAADAAQWERYAAASFTTVQQDGSFMTRAERLANLKTQKPMPYVARSRGHNVAKGDVVLTRFFNGGFWVLEVWSRESGAWMVLASQVTTAAQERFVRAEENGQHDLVITTSSGQPIVIGKSDKKRDGEQQVGFKDVAISPDGQAVAWTALFPNCCTSYPVPMLVEVYTNGRRTAFDPAIAPWHWCFVDGSTQIAALSTTVHGPQNEILELWDIPSGKKLEDFTWMDGEAYPRAPKWVVSIRNARDSQGHYCSSR